MNPTTTQVPEPAAAPARPVPRSKWLLIGGAALVGLLVLALVVVIALSVVSEVIGDGDDGDRDDHVVTGPRAGRTEATVELLSGVTAVTVRAVDLGGPLYRVRTPQGGRHVPQVTDRDGLVQVQLGESGRSGPSTVEIELATATRWHVRIVGGATQQTIDLSAGRVAEVALVGGATSVDLTLPRPAGNVPVRMVSGVATWAVHLPDGVPAQVFVGAGAGTVTVDGATRTGVAGGTTVTGDGWAQAADRYEVIASGGMSTFTLDRR
jgi:hypothetical protein